MPARLKNLASGGSLTARALRSSMLTIGGYGFAQVVRLLSNLVLTRVLFPEAFGLMGLVTVILTGLIMFSDFGIGAAIAQSGRGDDPDFLDTAWTLNLIRGVLLFAIGCALAWPISAVYDKPVLAGMIALASTQFLIAALMPTRRETANRHLMLGRVTLLEMVAQVISLSLMVGLAISLRSVWALIWGSLFGMMVQVALMSLFLPGQRNRIRWEMTAVHQLLHFGKWIFLSTICGFLLSQGDKLILGKFLPLDVFGVYNIGFFLGSFPMLLGMVVITRILIPIYRDRPPAESRENFLKLRKMRVMVTGGLLAMLATIAFSGVWLVDLLYDNRYRDAGAIVVLIACMQIPVIIGLTYDQAALAAGDSRRFLVVSATKATLVLTGIFLGVQAGGLPGAIIGQGLGILAAYPALVWLAARLGVWDPAHDLGFAGLGLLFAAGAVWWNWQAIAALAG
ncbi:MAG: polysaccharide biosynthesis protein [Alphaproteobacteria bacterium]|nr:MAG: polysaccharide biosynthesis protein [Alphaproteobacteria bacterium]